jgi:hypothetical protein
MTTEKAQTIESHVAQLGTGTRRKLAPAGYRGGAIIDSVTDWEAIELSRRAHAGLWSARTALVLSVPFAVTAWALGQEHAWFMYMLLPVIAAFFAGVFFGAAICDRRQITDEALAGRRGALVALATYIIFALEVGALSVEPFEASLDAFMASLLISGWVAFPVAFFAGILAFRAREGAHRYKQPAEAGVSR